MKILISSVGASTVLMKQIIKYLNLTGVYSTSRSHVLLPSSNICKKRNFLIIHLIHNLKLQQTMIGHSDATTMVTNFNFLKLQ